MEREVVSRGRLAIESRRNLRPTVWITYFFDGNRLIPAPLLREYKHLQREDQKIPPRVLNLRYADKKALPHSLREITSSLVFTF
jgi:hypothetical protein